MRFGFGQRTGVDLPGERAGNIRSLEHMGPVETATMAFGQGLTATPLQIAAAYAAVANGGTLVPARMSCAAWSIPTGVAVRSRRCRASA